MSDLFYISLTLVCFAGLSLLVGLIDRRLGFAATDPDPGTAPDREIVTTVDAGVDG